MKTAVLVRTHGLAQRLVFEHNFDKEPRVGDLIEMPEATADGEKIVSRAGSARVYRVTDRVWLRDGSLAYLATEESALPGDPRGV